LKQLSFYGVSLTLNPYRRESRYLFLSSISLETWAAWMALPA